MLTECFYRYIQFEKRFSKHTLLSYKNDVSQFLAFLEREFELNDVSQANHQMVRSWVVALLDDHAPASIARKLSTLRSYFKFLQKEGCIATNPAARIKAPHAAQRLPVFIAESSMQQLLDNYTFDDGFKGLRDRLVMEMFYQTGMRSSELIHLAEKNIDLHTAQFKIMGKGNKERVIPMNRELTGLISTYIEQKKLQNFDNKPGSLFVTIKGNKLSPKAVYNLVKRHLSNVSTVEKRSPHVLRHTFATHMLDRGADLNAVKELLGHASLAATQVYTHSSTDRLKKIYQQAHPKSGK